MRLAGTVLGLLLLLLLYLPGADDVIQVAVGGDVRLSVGSALVERPPLQAFQPDFVRQLGDRVLRRSTDQPYI